MPSVWALNGCPQTPTIVRAWQGTNLPSRQNYQVSQYGQVLVRGCEGGCLCLFVWREAPRCQTEWVPQRADLLHAEKTRQKHRIYADLIWWLEYISKRKFVFNLDLSTAKGNLGNEWVRVSLRSDHQFGDGGWVIFQIAGPILVWKVYLPEISFWISGIFEFQLSL